MEKTPEFLLSNYDDVRFIAEGAYGRVYKCTHNEIITAVKILDALDSESQERFKTEIEILRRIDHVNIVKLLDAGETDGHYWYESEYANQGHFGQMQGYLFYSDLDRVDYFRQICLGVQALHNLELSIIHRDLKPSNILVFEYPNPAQQTILKIADFGLATITGITSNLTATGVALGTADYIAPERIRDPRIKTPASDIYSLGITFLEACTGRTRPSQENLNLVPEILKPIIEQMVREHPRNRYQSISDILEAFDSLCSWRLFTGREPQENEVSTPIYQVNIGRNLENALNSLYTCNSENVFNLLANLETLLDRLGEAHDHEALTLMNTPRNAMAMIDKANHEELLRIVQRFMKAAECTKDSDFFSPAPQSWSCFLADTFALSSYRPTKHLCLEGLAKFLFRFKTHDTKVYLAQTIQKLDDPDHTEFLAARLREVDCEEVAKTLDGVPEQRTIDLQALQIALINIV